ncbi:MAG: Zn-dependent hydrolase [Pseudomonadota bacterium]
MNEPAIDGGRLWASLMELAQLGATPAGGCNRQALTEIDAQGRALFTSWAETIGCRVHTDAIGNLFARRDGTDPDAPAILLGSHLDTQPTGGRFDGVYGVLAGLEVLRTLEDLGLHTRSPVIVASWTNEEGARFPPAMMGSGAWAGEFDLEATYATADKDGVTVREALSAIGALGETPAEPFPVKGAFELHIEQGPILEAEQKTIGVVTGVQGIRWYDLTLTGKPCHAGPTPMEVREDPVQTLGEVLTRLYPIATDHAPWGRATVGDLVTEPGSRNTVPERIRVTVDLRHPDQEVLEAMHERLGALCTEQNRRGAVQVDLEEIWYSPAIRFDDGCLDAIRTAVERTGDPSMEIVSGAGHDAAYVSRVAPTAMIFIPCRDGLSHNEAEYAKPEDITAGANVLLNAVLALDAS